MSSEEASQRRESQGRLGERREASLVKGESKRRQTAGESRARGGLAGTSRTELAPCSVWEWRWGQGLSGGTQSDSAEPGEQDTGVSTTGHWQQGCSWEAKLDTSCGRN